MNRALSITQTLSAGVATLALALLLAGCGAPAPVEVADMTPIPIYTPWLATTAPAVVAATATPLPATEEPTPAPPTATTASTATSQPTATAEPTATETPAATATALPSPTNTEVPPEAPTAEVAATAPAAVGETAAVEAPAEAMPLPADFAAALDGADAATGEQLTVSNGCIACHSLVEGQTLVGPSWYGVGSRAANRVPGESAPFYLYQSIMEPNAHVVEGFTPDLMPKVYADTLSTAQIADIVAYLLSLQAE